MFCGDRNTGMQEIKLENEDTEEKKGMNNSSITTRAAPVPQLTHNEKKMHG